jgi:tRNA-guanine family transglycosylase
MLCGVVLGGSDERLRAYATEEICKRNIDGLFVSGLDSIDEEEKRNALIDTVIKHSKSSLPRFLGGIGDPKDVLNAVEKGMDAFISAYPYKETQKNSALIFWVDEKDNVKEREMERNRSGVHIFLKDKRFEKDFRPLLHDCECFSCKNYSRAYIHHLLNVKEMLGDVLLFTHNIFHYFRFFRTIRAQIGTQQFRAYKKLFTSKYQL